MRFAVIVGLALLAASPARGDGIELAARLGAGVPLGDASSLGDDPLRDTYTGSLPLELEAGYRIGHVVAGAYFQWGHAWLAKGATTSMVGDGGSVVHAGLQGMWRSSALGAFEPWAGLGLGYEWANVNGHVSAPEGRVDIHSTMKGFEGMLQGGVEYRVAGRVALGPFLALTVGRYDEVSVDSPYATGTTAIREKAFHEWLQIGFRGTFDLSTR